MKENAKPVIELDNVHFSYAGVPVLENVTFTVYERELLSIVGPNGGGKSTLLKLILGLIQPDKGTIRVLGGPADQARQHIGYMPQYMQFDHMFPVSVREIVLMGRLGSRLGGPYSRADKRATQDVLAQMELTGLETKLLSELSGGQKQRVLISRALVSNPQILLLDEPTSNVDISAEARFFELLQEMNKRLTILIVSHDLGFVSTLVEKVICVNRTVCVHPTNGIDGKVIQELYSGKPRVVLHDHEFNGKEGKHDGISQSTS